MKRRTKTIAAVVEDGYMPPWKPVPHGLEFANKRNLSKAQKATLLA